MTSSGTIDYEALAQDAMRGVIRKILKTTEQSGLPGEHHFYISFDTGANGVVLSKRLRERYPEDMTIVLQHRFWDLAVGEDYFEVKLTFDSIPERLVIPFKAIKVFFDPSVRYALQFESPDFERAMDEADGTARNDAPSLVGRPSLPTAVAPKPIATLDRKPLPRRRPEPVPEPAEEPVANTAEPPAVETAAAPADEVTPLRKLEVGRDGAAGAQADAAGDAPAEPKADESSEGRDGAVVVSLDQFRKK